MAEELNTSEKNAVTYITLSKCWFTTSDWGDPLEGVVKAVTPVIEHDYIHAPFVDS